MGTRFPCFALDKDSQSFLLRLGNKVPESLAFCRIQNNTLQSLLNVCSAQLGEKKTLKLFSPRKENLSMQQVFLFSSPFCGAQTAFSEPLFWKNINWDIDFYTSSFSYLGLSQVPRTWLIRESPDPNPIDALQIIVGLFNWELVFMVIWIMIDWNWLAKHL